MGENTESPVDGATEGGRLSACLENPSERLKKLREAVDKGGNLANANFLAYLAILIYFFVSVTSTTHEDLLRETPKAVPLLNIQLPLWWFFLVGPMALALIHLNLLNQYFYLAQNGLLLDNFIAHSLKSGELTQEQADEERKLPLSFALSNLILDRHMPPVLRISVRLLLWFFVVLSPLAVMLLFQAYFIPYHDGAVTWMQRFVILGDAMLLLYLWQAIAKAQGNHTHEEREVYASVNPDVIMRSIPVSTAWAVVAGMSSVFLLTIPGELYDSWDGDKFTDKRNIYLPNKLLLKSDPPPELLATYAGSLEKHDQVLNELADKHGLGLKLKGRDLRGASLSGAKLPFADLTEAHLEGANLFRTHLEGALMPNANLDIADLAEAHLEGANLFNVSINAANFTGAHLDGVNMSSVAYDTVAPDFTEANLSFAQMSFWSVNGVQARRADFRGAVVAFASINNSDLREAIFGEFNNDEFCAYKRSAASRFSNERLVKFITAAEEMKKIIYEAGAKNHTERLCYGDRGKIIYSCNQDNENDMAKERGRALNKLVCADKLAINILSNRYYTELSPYIVAASKDKLPFLRKEAIVLYYFLNGDCNVSKFIEEKKIKFMEEFIRKYKK